MFARRYVWAGDELALAEPRRRPGHGRTAARKEGEQPPGAPVEESARLPHRRDRGIRKKNARYPNLEQSGVSKWPIGSYTPRRVPAFRTFDTRAPERDADSGLHGSDFRRRPRSPFSVFIRPMSGRFPSA